MNGSESGQIQMLKSPPAIAQEERRAGKVQIKSECFNAETLLSVIWIFGFI